MLKLSLFLAIAATTADAFAPSSGLGLRASKAPLAASSRTGISSRHASSASGITMAAVPLSTIELKNKAGHSTTIYPFGACVTSYKAPHEVLFVRPDAKMDGSKPISGGVPHCFPQFGPGKIQQHGFARNLIWDVRSKSDEEGQATLVLSNNEETMAMWPNKFEATYKVGKSNNPHTRTAMNPLLPTVPSLGTMHRRNPRAGTGTRRPFPSKSCEISAMSRAVGLHRGQSDSRRGASHFSEARKQEEEERE
jgi:hypothetical protein